MDSDRSRREESNGVVKIDLATSEGGGKGKVFWRPPPHDQLDVSSYFSKSRPACANDRREKGKRL